jgi:long-subunit acyl-CoA synthetase (AMP-forming)
LHKENPGNLLGNELLGCKTLWELYQRCIATWPDKKFLGTRNNAKEGRPYEWTTFRQVYDNMDALARGKNSNLSYLILGISHLGLASANHDDGMDFKFLGIFGKNSEQWATVDLACLRSALTVIPFFDSLG